MLIDDFVEKILFVCLRETNSRYLTPTARSKVLREKDSA